MTCRVSSEKTLYHIVTGPELPRLGRTRHRSRCRGSRSFGPQRNKLESMGTRCGCQSAKLRPAIARVGLRVQFSEREAGFQLEIDVTQLPRHGDGTPQFLFGTFWLRTRGPQIGHVDPGFLDGGR